MSGEGNQPSLQVGFSGRIITLSVCHFRRVSGVLLQLWVSFPSVDILLGPQYTGYLSDLGQDLHYNFGISQKNRLELD